MEIKFLELQFQNFLSYGNNITTINLNSSNVTLIVGENLDDPNSGSNGVGKTTIANALTYVLYDKALSDIKINDLINNINKKNMFVSITFKKGADYYKIFRARKFGKSGENVIKIFKNNNTDFTDEHDITPMAANHKIQEIIGMDYNMFIRIIVVSATHQSFLKLPVASGTTNQVDFIEQLFDLTILSEKAVKLKTYIKENEVESKIEKQKIEQTEKEYNRLQEQINTAKQRVDTWEKNKINKINELTKQLELINDIDVEKEHKHYLLSNELTKLINENKHLSKHKATQLKTATNILQQLNIEHNQLLNNKCPYCLQNFANASDKIIEIDKQINECVNNIDELEQDISTLLEEQEQLLTKKIENDQIGKYHDNLDELIKIHNEKHTIIEKIEDLTQAVNAYIEPLNELLNTEHPVVDYKKIDDLKVELAHQEFLYKLLTKKDSFLRKEILNQNLPYLNNRLQHYLNLLGMSYKIQFMQDMSPNIIHFGRTLNFGNLSNGQQARVNIALSMSFRDILQKLHTPVNILILDESLDVGLDNSGVSSAIRMLKHKALEEKLSMFIISHRDEISNMFDNIITIQMKNGFSNIV